MNRFTLPIVLTCLFAVSVAQAADEEDHAAHHPDADQSQVTAAPDDKAAGMKMEKMQEQMKKMQEQMEKIHSAKDPQERQKLMQEHMQSMREGMKMMGAKKKGSATGAAEHEHGQDGAGAQGGDQMADCMKMMEGMMGGGMKMKHKMMEDRMDMMQMMMEQMMEHEEAQEK